MALAALIDLHMRADDEICGPVTVPRFLLGHDGRFPFVMMLPGLLLDSKALIQALKQVSRANRLMP